MSILPATRTEVCSHLLTHLRKIWYQGNRAARAVGSGPQRSVKLVQARNVCFASRERDLPVLSLPSKGAGNAAQKRATGKGRWAKATDHPQWAP